MVALRRLMSSIDAPLGASSMNPKEREGALTLFLFKKQPCATGECRMAGFKWLSII